MAGVPRQRRPGLPTDRGDQEERSQPPPGPLTGLSGPMAMVRSKLVIPRASGAPHDQGENISSRRCTYLYVRSCTRPRSATDIARLPGVRLVSSWMTYHCRGSAPHHDCHTIAQQTRGQILLQLANILT